MNALESSDRKRINLADKLEPNRAEAIKKMASHGSTEQQVDRNCQGSVPASGGCPGRIDLHGCYISFGRDGDGGYVRLPLIVISLPVS